MDSIGGLDGMMGMFPMVIGAGVTFKILDAYLPSPDGTRKKGEVSKSRKRPLKRNQWGGMNTTNIF